MLQVLDLGRKLFCQEFLLLVPEFVTLLELFGGFYF